MRIGSGIAAYHRELLLGPGAPRLRAGEGSEQRTASADRERAAVPPVAQVVEGEVLGRQGQYEPGYGYPGAEDPFGGFRSSQGAGTDALSPTQRRMAVASYQAHAGFAGGNATAAGSAAIGLYA